MSLIGYARVSTLEQNLNLQIDALKKAGCEKIFTDKVSGIKSERTGLNEAIQYLRKGDKLVVWRLDRLARSLKDLILKVNDLQDRGIALQSVQEAIDTSTSGGKLIFHIFGALAEFERDVIKERTLAGLQAARARGKMGGRPNKLNSEQIKLLKETYKDKTKTIRNILETFNISKSTLYRSLKK